MGMLYRQSCFPKSALQLEGGNISHIHLAKIPMPLLSKDKKTWHTFSSELVDLQKKNKF